MRKDDIHNSPVPLRNEMRTSNSGQRGIAPSTIRRDGLLYLAAAIQPFMPTPRKHDAVEKVYRLPG